MKIKIFAFFEFIFLAVQPLKAAESRSLACYYYDKFEPLENSSPFHAGLPWLWAKGIEGESIYVSGVESEGFFEIYEITGRESGCFGSRVIAKYNNSVEMAESLCKRALKYAFPTAYENKALLNMQVKSSFLSINNLPPIFGELGRGTRSTVKKVYIFGDSLSDQGNLQSWLRLVPGAPYFGGRFSNGPNWVDYLQQQTGIAVQNWAVGGSVSKIQEDKDYDFSIKMSGSVEEEIRRFSTESLKNKSLKEPEATLFVLWIGGNDYLSKLYSEQEINIFVDEPNNPLGGSNIFIAEVTNNIIAHLHSLKALGARNILVLNQPDIGTIPRLLENTSYHSDRNEDNNTRLINLSHKLTQITQRHNQELKDSLEKFSKRFSGLKIIYGDAYNGLRNMVLSRHFQIPYRHLDYQLDPNFLKTLVEGNKQAHIHQACFKGTLLGGKDVSSCPNPERVLFWDPVHPTSFGHCMIAFGIQRNLNKNEIMSGVEANDYLQRCRPELRF